ncbi:hypothetical protein AB0K00_56220 [Dactylosporangium sp. NPDC049525]
MRRWNWVAAGVAVALAFGGWRVLPWLPTYSTTASGRISARR